MMFCSLRHKELVAKVLFRSSYKYKLFSDFKHELGQNFGDN